MDTIFYDEVGFSATEVIDAFCALVDELDNRLGIRQKKLARLFRSRSRQDTVQACEREYPEIFKDGSNTYLEQITKDREMDVSELKSTAYMLIDAATLTELFLFDTDYVSSLSGVPEETLKRIFNSLSHDPEEPIDVDVNFFRLDNPVWRRPLLQLSQERIFAPIPYLFFNDPKKILEGFIQTDKYRKKLTDKVRPEYLEEAVEALFKERFPAAIVQRGVFYTAYGKRVECDLLVQIDQSILIIEAKSSSVSQPALRGSLLRMKKEIGKLIEAPSIQSKRLADLLKGYGNGKSELKFESDISDFDFDNFTRIVRLSVTLDDLATLQSRTKDLIDANLLSSEVEVAPTMIISDLEMVFEILKCPALVIHYLSRRSEMQENIAFEGYEAQWLSFYLLTGFNISARDFAGKSLSFPMGEKEIETYYQRKEMGMPASKPLPRVSSEWRRILGKLAVNQMKGWTEAAYILLSFSVEEQDHLVRAISKMRKSVRKESADPNHRNTLLISPEIGNSDSLAFVFFLKRNFADRDRHLQTVCDKAFKDSQLKRCLIISRVIDRGNQPYDSAAIFFSSDNYNCW